jgi:HD-like signal output (HDOD) protein
MLLNQASSAELIAAANELPTAPRLLIELGILLNDANTDSHDVTELLKRDPAIAARLIRLANSVVYARTAPVSSTEGAVSCIGFEEVHRLVGALATKQLSECRLELHGISPNRLRNISLFTALLMEEMAGPTGESRHRCYTTGLLRSIGIMALERVGCRHGQIPPYNPGTGQPIDEWEKCHWGLDNCEAAEIILQEWRLPPETVLAVRHHYRPEPHNHPLVHLLSLASGSAYDRYQGISGEEYYWQANVTNFRKAGLGLQEFNEAADRAQATFQRLEAALA